MCVSIYLCVYGCVRARARVFYIIVFYIMCGCVCVRARFLYSCFLYYFLGVVWVCLVWIGGLEFSVLVCFVFSFIRSPRCYRHYLYN